MIGQFKAQATSGFGIIIVIKTIKIVYQLTVMKWFFLNKLIFFSIFLWWNLLDHYKIKVLCDFRRILSLLKDVEATKVVQIYDWGSKHFSILFLCDNSHVLCLKHCCKCPYVQTLSPPIDSTCLLYLNE